MSSFNPANYSNNSPHSESGDHHQRQPPALHPPYPQHHQQQQHQHQQTPHPTYNNMFERQSSRSMPHAPFTNKKPVVTTSIEGEEIEVIGSDFSTTFDSRAKRLPLRLPQLNYNYPESTERNFSPGTSRIFNAAYMAHSNMLPHPYLAPLDEADRYQRIQGPLSQEIHPEQQQQRLTYSPREPGPPSSYQQHPLEHSPYRNSYERQNYPYSTSRNQREYIDSRDVQYDDPMNRPPQRSPGQLPSAHRTPIVSPLRTEQSYDNQARASDHNDPHRPREDYFSYGTSFPHPSSQPPPQHFPSDSGRHMPPPPSHPTPPATQHWTPQENDHPNAHHQYEGSGHYPSSQPQHPSQHRLSMESWEEHKPPAPTAAIDIPQRNRGSASYSSSNMHEPMDTNMRSQHHQSQYGQPSTSTGSSNFRGSIGQRPTGPRYALSRVHYRMIFEYASEIRECLIKGKVGTTDRLLYNAEILSKVFLGCRTDIDPNAPVEEESVPNQNQQHCTSCNSVKTPEWRKGPLGPRTLCNACGLIWGKMSRNKAALVAKSKQDPTSTKGDVVMTETKSEEGPNLADGMRKRGREMSSAVDEDEVESQARDEDRWAIEKSRLIMEASHLSDGKQAQSEQPTDMEPNESNLNEDGASDEQVKNQPGFDSAQHSSANSPTSSKSDGHKNQDEETPAVRHKLELSYLLA
ncbi:hypothetical protein BGZ49_003225 [Haplosporangium sp. Z 27]|nr:hypothetical protein BGZ49_003225 [Haplosporangium sp. Z 27]